MTIRNYITGLPVLMLAGALIGCGGGGGSVNEPDLQPPPEPPTATIGLSGLVSKFGPNYSSITIGGQVFDTTSQSLDVTINDQPASLSELRVGNIVEVSASASNNSGSASARSIRQQDELKGPISSGSIDLINQVFVVLGQTIQVSSSTLFDDNISPRSLDGLAAGDIVEISGMANADGVVIATRIEKKIEAVIYEVRGTVANLDVASSTFSLNALTVDYSSASLRDLPGGSLQDGLIVEAKGVNVDANGTLIATEVEGKSPSFSGDNGDRTEIEGYVTRFVSPADFDVAGLPVSAGPQTEYERGSEADLGLNARLEAKGALNADGVLIASKIEFKTGDDQADVEIEATIDSIDSAQNQLIVLGIPVTVDARTRLEDSSDADLEPFNLSDFNPGDYVEVRGYEDPVGSGNVTALRIERDDSDDDTELQGVVESVNRPSLTILGVTINTSSSTQFEGFNDERLSADQFFDRVAPGQVVKAEGRPNAGGIDAEEVEFED